MAVRFKLDLVGIKVSLRQWSRLTLQDRTELLGAPCHSRDEVAALRGRLIEMINLRKGGEIKEVEVESPPDWSCLGRTPEAVERQARLTGVDPPTASMWDGLTHLERFALTKLSRDGHDNVNFAPALREFGLPTAPSCEPPEVV